MLGTVKIERNEQLQEEVAALWDILGDFRDQADTKHLSSQMQQQMIEMPQRNLLQREIKFFVDEMRRRAHKKGLDPSVNALDVTLQDRNVVDYVLSDVAGEMEPPPSRHGRPPSAAGRRPGSSRSSSRCSSGGGRPGSLRGGGSAVSMSSVISEAEEVVEAIAIDGGAVGEGGGLSVLTIGSVIERLREALEEEHTNLLQVDVDCVCCLLNLPSTNV